MASRSGLACVPACLRAYSLGQTDVTYLRCNKYTALSILLTHSLLINLFYLALLCVFLFVTVFSHRLPRIMFPSMLCRVVGLRLPVFFGLFIFLSSSHRHSMRAPAENITGRASLRQISHRISFWRSLRLRMCASNLRNLHFGTLGSLACESSSPSQHYAWTIPRFVVFFFGLLVHSSFAIVFLKA